jgi:hypothetical protein
MSRLLFLEFSNTTMALMNAGTTIKNESAKNTGPVIFMSKRNKTIAMQRKANMPHQAAIGDAFSVRT